MKPNEILKLLRENKLDLNDKDILKSKEFEDYLKSVSKDLYERVGIEQDKLKLSVNYNKDNEPAYIKKDTIYINLGATLISCANDNKLKMILGYYAHEIGHRLFTDFSTHKLYESSILNSQWYPKMPEFEDKEINANQIKMDKYLKNPKKSGKLCSILLFIYDVIEDSRVEEHIYKYLSNYGRLIDGLNVLRDTQYKNIKPYTNYYKDTKSYTIDYKYIKSDSTYYEDTKSYTTYIKKEDRFYDLLNQIICYIKFGEFKDFNIDELNNIDEFKNIKEVQNLIDETINEVSQSKVLSNINKIAILLWDEIENYLEKFTDVYEDNSSKIKALMSFEVSEDLYENSEATSTLGETNTKGEAKEKLKNVKDKKDLVETEGTDTMEINADGKSNYKSTLAQDENALKLKNTSKEDRSNTSSINDENEETLSGEISDKDSFGQGKFNLDHVEESEKRRELNKSARSISYGDIHKGIKINVHRPEFTYEDKLNYLKENKKYVEIANQLARQVLPLLENEVSSEYSNNRYYGTKFNASAVVKNDFRYFGRKNPPNESPSLAVALRIDESGSMKAGDRIEIARAAAIMLWEFCKICKVPIGIYGDTADISSLENVSIYSYSDFDNEDPNDCYRMMQIKPKSNNRDGVSIKFVAERLSTVEADIKLLFVISDGNPLAKPDYKGEVAYDDLKKVVSDYSRKGINFFAAAIGDDRDMIKKIYWDDKFLDISNLNSLPNRIAMILKNLI